MFKHTYQYAYQIELPSVYNNVVNCYLLEYESHYILIDTGENTDATKTFWKELLLTLQKPITHILLTHIHTDHAGCCSFLSNLLNCQIIASEQSFKKLQVMKKSPKNIELLNSAARYGYEYPYTPKHLLDETEAYNFTITETFEDGDVLQLGEANLQTIYTPGHANDQFCFYDAREQILFASDHLLAEFSPVLIIEENQLNPLNIYFSSLDKIKYLPTKICFTGHGRPIENIVQRIEEIRNRHLQKVEQTKNILTHFKQITLESLLLEMYQKDLTRSSGQLMQLLCHLNYLEEAGDIQVTQQDAQTFLAIQARNSVS